MIMNKRPRVEHEQQNDTPVPESRLTRACAECKKHKIRCETQVGQTACNKCLRKGIDCVPYNFAQKFIDDDAVWKAQTASNLDQLQTAVQYLLRQSNLPDLAKFNEDTLPHVTTASTASTADIIDETPSVQDDSDLVPPPMSNLYSLTETRHAQSVVTARELDFIDKGIIAIAEAQDLFSHYRDHINPLLWGGALCSYQTLAETRRSSPLLTSAVLTVAALHGPERRSVQTTYDVFVSVVKSSCLARGQNLDDIRGLCIGAFYITNMSWRIKY